MKYAFFALAIFYFSPICNAQDTLQINCSDKIVGLSASSSAVFQITGNCDSVYVLNRAYYSTLVSGIENYKKFYTIFEQYKNTVKAADADMSNIISSYDQIIKSKDAAFNTLYTEYSRMNKLLDKSVGQTKKAVNLGETTLKEVKEINGKLQNENLKLNESLTHLKDIAQREKINAGLRGGIIGGTAAIIVGGIIGGILGYNLHR